VITITGKNITASISIVMLAVLLVCLPAGIQAASDEARELQWEDLMPKDWMPFDPWSDLDQSQIDKLTDGSAEEKRLMRQYIEAQSSAPVVGALDGQRVRLPGYVVPLDYESTDVSEFLLVPYFGACIHVPPPPSNQIVYVKAKTPYSMNGMFTPVWVTGTLTTQAVLNLVGDAGYTLTATKVEPYE
jgi:uncharacterized protein